MSELELHSAGCTSCKFWAADVSSRFRMCQQRHHLSMVEALAEEGGGVVKEPQNQLKRAGKRHVAATKNSLGHPTSMGADSKEALCTANKEARLLASGRSAAMSGIRPARPRPTSLVWKSGGDRLPRANCAVCCLNCANLSASSFCRTLSMSACSHAPDLHQSLVRTSTSDQRMSSAQQCTSTEPPPVYALRPAVLHAPSCLA